MNREFQNVGPRFGFFGPFKDFQIFDLVRFGIFKIGLDFQLNKLQYRLIRTRSTGAAVPAQSERGNEYHSPPVGSECAGTYHRTATVYQSDQSLMCPG